MNYQAKILIVEHSKQDIDLLEYELRKGGIDFVSEIVQNQNDFRNALEIFVPDIILCDYSLPSFDGSTAFKIREAIAPDTPFIFVSGVIGEENSIQFVENGVTDYALKDKLFTLPPKIKRALNDFNARQLKARTDHKLTVSERKLSRAQQLAHVGSWELDFSTNILLLSEEGCRIFGFPADQCQLSFQTWFNLVHPDDLHQVFATIEETRETYSDTSYYHRIILSDGSIRHICSESKFEFDSTGKAIGLYGTMQDVTERKEAEDKLKKANRLYAFISQVNQTIAHVSNEDTLFHEVCRIAIECGEFKVAWIGMFSNEHKNITLLEHSGIPDGDINLFTNATVRIDGPQHRVIRDGKSFVCNNIEGEMKFESEHPFIKKQNIRSLMVLPIKKSNLLMGTFNLYAEEVNFFDRSERALLEEVAGEISFALDFFEKKRESKEAKVHLIQSEKRFRAIIEKSMDMKTLATPDGKILYASPAVTKVLGYSVEDFRQIPSFELIHPRDIDSFVEKFMSMLAAPNNSFFSQHRMLHKNGDWLWCEGTMTNLLHDPGIEAIVANFRDISQKKEAEQQKEFDSNNLSALINNTTDLMWSVDKDFKLITCNIPFSNLTESIYGKAIHPGDNVLSVDYPIEQLERYKAYYLRAFNGETFKEIDYTSTPVDYWTEISFHPIWHGTEVIGTACHARDISAIKKSEEQLKHSETFTRGVLNALSSHIAVINREGNIISVNDSWTRFALENGETSLQRTGIGSNYFEVCEKAAARGDSSAMEVLKGIKDVMNDTCTDFYFEYPCHSPNQQRWFGMRAVKFESNEPLVVVAHIDISERKEATDKVIFTSTELKQALADINKIMDSSLDVICAVDEDGYFTQVSAACETVWGYTAEELIGKVQLDFVYLEDRPKTRITSATVKAGTNVTNFENRIIRKDGSLVPIVWSARWDAKDKVRYAVARDATEKKRAESAFENERIRFNELFLRAPTCIGSLKGADHIYEMANPLYLKLIGKENILGKSVKEISPELEDQGFIEILNKVFNTGKTFSGTEMKMNLDQNNDGNLVNVYFNFICQAHYNKAGYREGIFFFGIDVTEQVTSRILIEEREKLFRALSEKSTDMTALTTSEGELIYGSPSITKSLGHRVEDLLHKPIYNLIHPDDHLEEIANLMNKPGKSIFYQQRMLHKSGEWVWCEGIITNMLHEPAVHALVSNFRDVSERKLGEAEREKMIYEIKQRNKSLEQFAYIVSHNLRAPVANILALTSIIGGDMEKNKFLIEKVVEQTNKLDDVVRDINTIVSARRTGTESMELIRFETILHQIINVLNAEIATSQATIQMDFSEQPEVFTVKSYLYSIIYNLMSNAIKYRLPDVPLLIDIKTSHDNKFICLRVKDNGSGIDLVKNGTKLFGLYKRFHEAPIPGKGIGLNLVKNHVESLGGRVDVESEINEGASFMIYLPKDPRYAK